MTTTIPLVTIEPTAWTVTADGVTLGIVTRTGSVYRVDHDPDGAAYGTLSTAAGAILRGADR